MTSFPTAHDFFIYLGGHRVAYVFLHLRRFQTLQPCPWAVCFTPRLLSLPSSPSHPTPHIPGVRENVYRKILIILLARPTSKEKKKEEMKQS